MPAEKNISIIPANPKIGFANGRVKKLRVAAYCRVSTDQEEQQSSYQAQIEYYTNKIENNPEWTLVGIFADEGISGTSAKKRTEFIKLMQLCKSGKVDLVLTKSISRFSRNTLDCLFYIRMLRERSIPIIFEKEGINTMQMASEMTISLLGSFAQAESESLSKNVTWGIRQSFRSGNVSFQYSRFLGYKKGEDGKPEIVPEEAEIVKRVFRDYLAGYSVQKIKTGLESEGILSPTGKKNWSPGVIQYMLKNEKYTGDALLQKTYVIDFISKKCRKNNGELPKYYVTGNHEPIISKEIFSRVQEEIARRNSKRKIAGKNAKTENGKYSSKYALSDILFCGKCGTQYRRVTWARNGTKKIVWRCINRLEYGKKLCADSPTIDEDRLQTAIVRAISLLVEDRDELFATLKEGLSIALGANVDTDTFAIERRIKELNAIMIDLVQVSAKSDTSVEYFDEQFKQISDEIKALQEQLNSCHQEQSGAQNRDSRLGEIFGTLEIRDISLTSYDEQLVRQLIDRIKVTSDERIVIAFKGGYEIEQVL